MSDENPSSHTMFLQMLRALDNVPDDHLRLDSKDILGPVSRLDLLRFATTVIQAQTSIIKALRILGASNPLVTDDISESVDAVHEMLMAAARASGIPELKTALEEMRQGSEDA